MAVRIVVDGSNLCTLKGVAAHAADLFRLERLISTVIEQAPPDAEVRVYVDASLRHKLSKPHADRLSELIDRGAVTQAPANIPADDFLLQWADANGALVISNDTFSKYHSAYRWLSTKRSGRCVAGDFDATRGVWTLLERHPGDQPARSLRQLIEEAAKSGATEIAPQAVARNPVNEYSAKVTTQAPHAVVLLIDQSGSMRFPWGTATRSQRLADMVNATIRGLVIRSTDGPDIKHRFDVAVIGYGGDGLSGVRSLAPATTLADPFCPIDRLAAAADLVEEVSGGRIRRRPRWILPHASGETPMVEAIECASAAIAQHAAKWPRSFPPVVINITDGEASTGDPVSAADAIKRIRTEDGAALVFAAHIGGEPGSTLEYPVIRPDEAPKDILVMFDMASVVPDALRHSADDMGINIPAGARACLYNATPEALIGMLNVGTTPDR